MNELPASASAKLILAAKRTGSVPRLPVTTISPCWSLPVGQVAADENLLGSGRDIRQPLGIEGRDLHATELNRQIAQPRLSDFVEPFERDRLWRLLAADRAGRAATDCGDPLHHGRFVDVAHGHAVQSPRGRGFLVPLLIRDHFRQPFDERRRIAVAGGHDPVADVNDLSAGRRPLQHGGERLIEIRPAQRDATIQKVAGFHDVVGRRRERLGRRPCRRHVAGGEHEMVFAAQRREDRGHEFGLLLPLFRIHRSRSVAEQHDIKRRAVGEHFALPIAVRRRGRQLHEQIAVASPTMRHDDHIRLPAVNFAIDFEIAIGRVFLGREFDRRRMFGLLRSRGMRRAGHILQRNRRIDHYLERQFADRLHPQQIAPQPVGVAVFVCPQRQNLRVDDFHPLFRIGFDREHTGFEQIAAGPFQQARIALLAEDRFVDFACPLFLDDIGFDKVVADPHAEAADRSVLRQREMEDALQPGVRMIRERFLDCRAGDLVANFDAHLVIADRKGFVAAVGQIHDQRTERFVRGSAFEAREPFRRLLDFGQLFIPIDAEKCLAGF